MTSCRIAFRSGLLPVLTLAATSNYAAAQCTTSLVSGGPVAAVSGDVRAMTSWDPDGGGPAAPVLVAVGVNLTAGTHHARHVLVHDGTQWTDPGFPSGAMGNLPLMAAILFQGEVLVGGDFDMPAPGGGPAMRGIARWDGVTWRGVGTGVTGFVRALAVHNGELFAGGNLTQAGSVPVNNLARWNGTTWSAVGGGVNGTLHALASFAGQLWVGGALTVPGLPISNLARWNGTAFVAAGNPNGSVRAFAVRSTTLGTQLLFTGGGFSSIGGTAAQRVASVDAITATNATPTWSALGAGLFGTVVCLAVRNTGLFFEVVAGIDDPGMPRIRKWDGSAWTALANPVDPTFEGRPVALVVHGGRYVVGLLFTQRAVQAYDTATSSWTPVSGPGIGDTVHTVLPEGDDLIAGGAFTSIDGTTMNGIARRTGATWSPLDTGVQGGDGTVHALARLPDGDLVAGGNFMSAGGVSAINVARWNGTAWSAMGIVTGTVFALKTRANGQLVAGGNFDFASGSFVNGIAHWDGAAWQPMGPGINGTVLCLAETPSGELIAGGHFSFANVRHGVARWTGTSWLPLGSGMDDAVLAIATLPGGDIVAGGRFLTAGGAPRTRVARFDGTNWLALGPGANDTVRALAVLPDGDVLMGGDFTTTNGPTERLARWNGTSWSGFADGIDGVAVHTIAMAGSEVLVAGDFVAANSSATGNVARVTSSCPALATPYGVACASPAGTLTCVATQHPWIGGTFTSRTTGITSSFGIPVAMFGFQTTALPIAPLLPGYPGCIAHTAPDALDVRPLTPSGVTSTLPVAASASLVGAQLFHQIVFLDLATSGALAGIASSNGLALTIGTL